MIDLSQAKEGEELNPSAFNPDEYPTKDDILSFVLANTDTPPVRIDIHTLSVNGEVKKENMEVYLKSKHISSSNLKCVLKSPRMFYYDYEKVFTKPEKKYFSVGTFTHMALAEPELFEQVQIEPEGNKTTRAGILKTINHYKQLLGKQPIGNTKRKMEELREMCSSLRKRCEKRGIQFIQRSSYEIIKAVETNYNWYGGGIIKYLLKGAIPELSFYTVEESTGLPVKVRPDFLNFEENIGANAVISLKTTSAESIQKFAYDSAKYMYELSEGMYLEVVSQVTGRRFNTTIMIMLQTIPPYDVAVLFWQPEDLENGKYKYRHALSTVQECFDKKLFPGFDALAEKDAYGIIDFLLPEWSQKVLHPVDIDD